MKKLKNEEEKRVQQVRSGRKGERNPKKAPTHEKSREEGTGKWKREYGRCKNINRPKQIPD